MGCGSSSSASVHPPGGGTSTMEAGGKRTVSPHPENNTRRVQKKKRVEFQNETEAKDETYHETEDGHTSGGDKENTDPNVGTCYLQDLEDHTPIPAKTPHDVKEVENTHSEKGNVECDVLPPNLPVGAGDEREGGLTKGPFTRLSKNDLFVSWSDFQKVDEYALQAPKDASLSMQDIANYLISPFDQELLKIRAVWRWITDNIEYDVDTFFGRKVEEDKGDAFMSKKGVCEGYSSITTDLFSLCGIESVKIKGWAKGYYYIPGKKISDAPPNHSWNAVRLMDQWWLCDTTWGAGYVNDNKEFTKEYTEHFFLTNPEDFIYDHFPCDVQWQLLKSSVSLEEYESWAKFGKNFFSFNLKPLSHKVGVIDVTDGELDICFGFNENIDFLLELIKDDSSESMKDCCFVSSTDGVAHFFLNIPEEGLYTLKIFAKKSSLEAKTYTSVVTYKINWLKASENWVPFPSYLGSWKHGFVLYEPLSGSLNKDSDVKFRIAAPENIVEIYVCVNCDEWFAMSKGKDGVWEVSVNLPDATGDVKVMGNDLLKPDSGYSVLLSYVVK